MPRGIPKNRSSRGGMSKMEGVRRALGELGNDATPKEIQDYLRSRLAISMETPMISNYKSSLKGSGRSAMIRKPGPRARAAGTGERISLDDVRAVKEVVDKIGADKVRQLAHVLGK